MSLILTYELVFQATFVGLNPLQLVLVGVTHEATTFLFELPSGVLADMVSRRLSVIIGVFLIGAGFLLELAIPGTATVCVAQVLWGIGFTCYSGAESAWIIDEVGEEAAHAILLRATQFAQVAALVGSVAGTALAHIDIRTPILCGAVGYLALGAFLIGCMKEQGFTPDRSANHTLRQRMIAPLHATLRLVRSAPVLWIILLLGLTIGLSLGAFDRLFTPRLLSIAETQPVPWLQPAAWLGVINTVATVLSLGGTEILRRRFQLAQQRTIVQVLLASHAVVALASFGFAAGGAFVPAMLCCVLIFALRNVTRPLVVLWVAMQANSANRATVISAYWQANAFGQIVGSPALGGVALVSIQLALGIGSALYTLTLPLLAFARRRTSSVVSE